MESKTPFASFMNGGASTRSLSPFRSGSGGGGLGRGRLNVGTASRRNSHATSIHSFISSSDTNTQSDSCVTRETAQDDCARHRFIVWAAVKRNSSMRMTPEEKLECPLLRCVQRFSDHEAMLKHLATCNYLALGEYWCYDHMRVERFDDIKCKRCLGHPSKRKKMLSIARNFFHSLGHKSRKGFDDEVDDPLISPPPPAYSSLADPLLGDACELSTANEILEADSTEVRTVEFIPTILSPPEVVNPLPEAVIDPQALLIPTLPELPELDSTALGPDSDALMQWPPTTTIDSMLMTSTANNEARLSLSKPMLQLNTFGLQGYRGSPRPAPRPVSTVPRSKVLSPSSSVRSTASTDSTDSTVSTASNVSNITATSNSSSLVSPISNYSGVWSVPSGGETGITSPEDLIDHSGMFSNNPFADPSACGNEMECVDYVPEFFELPADQPVIKGTEDFLANDPSLFSFDTFTATDFSYATNIVLTEDTAKAIDLVEPVKEAVVDVAEVTDSNICCSETRSMVASAWDALQEHIVSSMVKIRPIQGNPLADQLRSLSPKTIASRGLQTLRLLLHGIPPSTAIDALCFVHLIYAFSLVIHEQDTPHGFKDLFLQSLTYTRSLPVAERKMYMNLACGIWQPLEVTQQEILVHMATAARAAPTRSTSLKGKQPIRGDHTDTSGIDALLVAAENFLDELEAALLLGQTPTSPEITASDLYTKHLIEDYKPDMPTNQAFHVATNFVHLTLLQEFPTALDLPAKIGKVAQRIVSGKISTVRRLEIETMHAGKRCMSRTQFYGSFAPKVRALCGRIYEQLGQGMERRHAYYFAGIKLIDHLTSDLDRTSAGDQSANLSRVDLTEFLNDVDITLTDVDDPALDFANIPNLPIPDLSVPQTATTTPSASSSAPPSSSNSDSDSPSATSKDSSSGGEKPGIEADSCCEICGYRPKGDPQWFKGSMAKHKKLQHSAAPPKIYKCPFPGCNSQYKSRPDNLRQHQIEKNHWVTGEEGAATARRPSKRKKLGDEE